MIAVLDKLLSAIRAALVLAGMLTLLGIAASTPAYWNFFHGTRWTYTGIRETFLATILLGLLLGWRFPAKVKKYCSSLVVALSTTLFLLANILLVIGEHITSPSEIKLADCSGSIVKFHLTVPKGRHYVLFLNGLPSGYMTNGSYISAYKFTGNLRITTGKSQITDIPLDSDKMNAFPSELSLGPVNLKARKDYDIQIQFNPPPPAGSSIWLYWMQNAAERGE